MLYINSYEWYHGHRIGRTRLSSWRLQNPTLAVFWKRRWCQGKATIIAKLALSRSSTYASEGDIMLKANANQEVYPINSLIKEVRASNKCLRSRRAVSFHQQRPTIRVYPVNSESQTRLASFEQQIPQQQHFIKV